MFIKVKVNTNTLRTEVISELGDTPLSVFEKLGVNVIGSMVNLNGTILNKDALRNSFEELGYKADDSVNLASSVKADNGAI